MNVLVTGGAGYVGSACARHLSAEGHNAVVYDNLVQGHPAAVGSIELVKADIFDVQRMSDTLQGMNADAVMHFAAATYVGESVTDPEYHYRNNIYGTLCLLHAMREANVNRLLFSSTCATYGDNPECPMTENTVQNPCSPYARTKLSVEWMIHDFSVAYNLGYTILRYFNAAGASIDGSYGEAHHPENHLIPLVLQIPLGQRQKLSVFGNDYPTEDGTCIRDYIHVDDLASAHLLAVTAMESGTQSVFNVGTGKGNSVLEIIKACEDVTSERIPYEVVDRRPGDAPALVADPKKLTTQLGWRPIYTDIRDIVAAAWNWHKSNPKGYEGK
jgi:UDP-glucose 4-epimerase